MLLATGTPISIALGLTVLVYLVGFSSFSMETVDIISQRLFTGLESFAIMAVPFAGTADVAMVTAVSTVISYRLRS